MTRRDIIEASLELAAARDVDLAPLVYARLFASRPETEAMFCLDRTGAVRGSMLNHALEVLLDISGERNFGEAFLRAETVNHGGTHGVTPELFAEFYEHLAATVRELAGPRWTSAMDAAWREATGELRSLSATV